MSYPSLKIVGLMSGTSLDGLDMAACTFRFENGKWEYTVDEAEAVDYDNEFRNRMDGLMDASALRLTEAHFETGYFFGEKVRDFIGKKGLKPDYIASHGQTVFHQPSRGMTLQIGHGSCIAAKTGISVVYDFRVLDVALGGQGAPLVPIGDKLLYGEYDYCLNLGGIANISYDNEEGRRVAFDICPVNMVLNRLAAEVGKAYDDRGSMARQGVLKEELFNKLENLSFYRQSGPKSLGKEWVDLEVLPLLTDSDVNLADRLHTFCHHIASRIAGTIKKSGKKKVLVTGGGAFNDFLIGILRQMAGAETEIIVPDNRTVMFKEAIIFAFLGYLRVLNLNNCLASVTGATKDSCGGVIAFP